MNMDTYIQDFTEKLLKRGIILIFLLVVTSLIIAICQSHEFASSLWIIFKVGFDQWHEYISRMIQYIVIWAIVTGAMFIIQFIVNNPIDEGGKYISGMLFSFVTGFISPFAMIIVLALAYYLPLGIASFIFPENFIFTSPGFAMLCSLMTVFLLIALDTPDLLIFAIWKMKSLYIKLIAILLSLLLIFQISSTLIIMAMIIIRNSVWRKSFYAFMIGEILPIIISILLVLILLRNKHWKAKILFIFSIYILSVIAGNMIEDLFQVGELTSALITIIVWPFLFTNLFKRIANNYTLSIFIISGITIGLGLGLGFAHIMGLRIVGQGLVGLFCGTSIAIGFGISLGFIFGPRIVAFIDKLLKIGIINTMGMGFGSIIGILSGTVIGGFLNR